MEKRRVIAERCGGYSGATLIFKMVAAIIIDIICLLQNKLNFIIDLTEMSLTECAA